MPAAPASLRSRLSARWHALPFFWQAQIAGWSLFARGGFRQSRACLSGQGHLDGHHPDRLPLPAGGLLHPQGDLRPHHRGGDADPAGAGAHGGAVHGGGGGGHPAGHGLRVLFGWNIPYWGPFEEFAIPFIHYAFVLTGWSICYLWVRAEASKQAAELRAATATAEALRFEIQHLRLQLDPHFLFNALNGIGEEIPENPDAALAMLRDLTDYLRHSLAGIERPIVPVEAEVASLQAYLRIQEARFGPRLLTRMEVDKAAAKQPIANFLLQPLVENAVKYGTRDPRLEVGIHIRDREGTLRIEVVNTGSLDVTVRRRGRGIGLTNLRRRLDVHYPGRASFSLTDEDGPTGMRVVARLDLEGAPCSAS